MSSPPSSGLAARRSPDVVIIGAGAIGAAAAHELARRGTRVLVLERSRDPVGCSHGSAGLVSPSHSESLATAASIRHGLAWMTHADSPFHVRPRLAIVPWLARFAAASRPSRSMTASATLRSLTATSLQLHEELAQSGVQTSFARRGILSVYESQHTYEAARRRLREGDADDAQDLTAQDARELLPALTRRVAGAIYHPTEGHCDPSRFVGASLDAARDAGAEIRFGVEALRLRRAGNRVTQLETTCGAINAGALVLAAGVWSRELARGAGVRLPLEGGKGYHLEMAGEPSRADVPAFLEDAHVTATPLAGRLRLTGTLDLSGTDLHVNPTRLRAIAEAARRTLDLPAPLQVSAIWRGLRPCAPDGLPIIGHAPGLENLVVATGHAMLGIALAPITAEMVADLVRDEPRRHPTEAVEPARFRRRGQVLHNQTHDWSLGI